MKEYQGLTFHFQKMSTFENERGALVTLTIPIAKLIFSVLVFLDIKWTWP